MNTNHSVRKDLVKVREQFECHMKLLEQQAFCLNLMKFFTEFPDALHLELSSESDQEDNYCLDIFINGKEEDCDTTIFKYFEDTISDADMQKLEISWGGVGLRVEKDNIQAACLAWMGEENYQKWKSLDMEDKLREHTKPLDESKQKRQKI